MPTAHWDVLFVAPFLVFGLRFVCFRRENTPSGVAWLALCWSIARVLPTKWRWDGSKVVSTMGAFLQVGFSLLEKPKTPRGERRRTEIRMVSERWNDRYNVTSTAWPWCFFCVSYMTMTTQRCCGGHPCFICWTLSQGRNSG